MSDRLKARTPEQQELFPEESEEPESIAIQEHDPVSPTEDVIDEDDDDLETLAPAA